MITNIVSVSLSFALFAGMVPINVWY